MEHQSKSENKGKKNLMMNLKGQPKAIKTPAKGKTLKHGSIWAPTSLKFHRLPHIFQAYLLLANNLLDNTWPATPVVGAVWASLVADIVVIAVCAVATFPFVFGFFLLGLGIVRIVSNVKKFALRVVVEWVHMVHVIFGDCGVGLADVGWEVECNLNTIGCESWRGIRWNLSILSIIRESRWRVGGGGGVSVLRRFVAWQPLVVPAIVMCTGRIKFTTCWIGHYVRLVGNSKSDGDIGGGVWRISSCENDLMVLEVLVKW